jgi:hypothetical protein
MDGHWIAVVPVEVVFCTRVATHYQQNASQRGYEVGNRERQCVGRATTLLRRD